jgi:WD40 repeat protein
VKELLDGTLVSGSADKSIKVWNPDNGKVLRTLEGHSDSIQCLEILSKAEYSGLLVSGCMDKSIKMWDTSQGELLKTFEMEEMPASMCLMDDGNLAIRFNSKIELVSLTNGAYQVLSTILGDFFRMTSLSDGSLVCTRDSIIEVWDLRSGRVLRTLKGHKSTIWSLLVLEDGRLASGGFDGEIRIWNPFKEGRRLRKFMAYKLKSVDSLVQLSNSKNGGCLVSVCWANVNMKMWRT